ncbi:hypothetical protein PF005_g9966 [Phytophthora fragariae]|uniref:Uncharacterized protein n=1 Tax=Phytophthora fragariae TaxID=53985 RepID=A0A6A3ZZH4_9STRA|nr:hypothetical protein PF003_g6332 [Phytophthora fragariae]KAE9126480.1 hypothetical protein PF007_g5967 [Phytophthora fragariae]KAE9151253.1 hypothetical protein PF006_g4437 [Phytophthora fragariae]KAE9214075.1 hypothetical protein PF005_g9966 [Phytophthora fragariae]KAE9247926.1 hypothetical protein PF002_g6035 [Phytophthora fragariae]
MTSESLLVVWASTGSASARCAACANRRSVSAATRASTAVVAVRVTSGTSIVTIYNSLDTNMFV